MRESNHSVAVRGEGNVVSIEFNLLYRWHSTLSEQNTKWLEEQFGPLFPKDASMASISAFKKEAGTFASNMKKLPPWEWTFGGLVDNYIFGCLILTLSFVHRKSRVDGRFKDADLAEILQDATCDVAGAFKARGIPECMRVIEVLGIMQSRVWGTCSVCSETCLIKCP